MMAMDARRTLVVAASCLTSVLLGLFFVFVWSPLPWGWKGIDFYYEIALSLARGEPFPTMHRVWGYAYFLAFWYWLFGDRQWVPLCVQVLLNATIPLMLYLIVRRGMGPRVAVVTAVLTGVASFNTVYASTQAADSVCTVLVVAAVLCLTVGDAGPRWSFFALAGLLLGVAYQFRPNFVLFPPFMAVAYLMFRPRSRPVLVALASFLLVFVLTGLPWVIRNYRWSGLFVPASTHGGVQLWFGTLQSGAYEDSWIYNPRAAFEYPPLDYTSVDEFPIIVTASASRCPAEAARNIDLVYWTSRDGTPRRLTAVDHRPDLSTFEVPRQDAPAALYFFFEIHAIVDGQPRVEQVPRPEGGAPMMTAISRDHLGDLDVGHDVLDIFDLARMMRHVAWHEPLPQAGLLDLDDDGVISEQDIHLAVAVLLHDRTDTSEIRQDVAAFEETDRTVGIVLRDGSAIAVPRQWSGRVTDLNLKTVGVGSMAASLVSRSKPFDRLRTVEAGPGSREPCFSIAEAGVNQVPYRRLPHEMRRFTALALDNIRHDPIGYVKASARRAIRVFVIEGSDDTRTAYQFARAVTIYRAGRTASLAYLALFVVGVVLAIRRGLPVLLLLTPIVFVASTICFVLINARYSMTVQPFMFAFVAIAVVTAMDAWSTRPNRPPSAR